MTCILFNFCPVCSAQSPRGGALVDLALQTKLYAPQIETWNTIKSVEVLPIFRISTHPSTNAKSPYRKPFRDGCESTAYSSFVHKKPNLTQMKQ